MTGAFGVGEIESEYPMMLENEGPGKESEEARNFIGTPSRREAGGGGGREGKVSLRRESERIIVGRRSC